MISLTGKNLSIVIEANSDIHSSWESYACWYSVKKFIPEAQISILVHNKRQTPYSFLWATKTGILLVNAIKSTPNITLPTNCLCLKKLDEEKIKLIPDNISSLFADSLSNKINNFVTYETCGQFNRTKWLQEKDIPPFKRANHLKTDYMTINEKKILEMWAKMASHYSKLCAYDNYGF